MLGIFSKIRNVVFTRKDDTGVSKPIPKPIVSRPASEPKTSYLNSSERDTVTISKPANSVSVPLNKDCDTHMTGWLKIPSRTSDPENFDKNVKKVQSFYKNDGSREYNTLRDNLIGNDYYIYLENGQAKTLVKVWRNAISGIHTNFNDTKVSPAYVDKINELMKSNNFQIPDKTLKSQFYDALDKKRIVDRVKAALKNDIKDKNYANILKYFNINVLNNLNGILSISNYCSPEHCSFEDLGINEQDMLDHVFQITGNADFSKSNIKSLKQIKSIGGNAFFGESFESLGPLEQINGNVSFKKSKLTDLGEIKEIGGDLKLSPNMNSLGKLKKIGGNISMACSPISTLGDLESIGGNADFEYSGLKNLGKLKYIGGDASFKHCQMDNLGQLQKIDGKAVFDYSDIPDLGNLEFIGGNGEFRNCKVKNLGKLKTIVGKLYAGNLPVDMFKNVNIQNQVTKSTYNSLLYT